MGELDPAWLVRKEGHLKPSAYRSYENAWRVYVEPRWRTAKVSDIRYTGVQAWIAELSKKLSASRVITVYAVLAGILDTRCAIECLQLTLRVASSCHAGPGGRMCT